MSATFCEHCAYKGKCINLTSGEYKRKDLLSMGMPDKSISSLIMKPNTSVQLFSNGNLKGKNLLLENDTRVNKFISCLKGNNFNNTTSSIMIKPFRMTKTKLREFFDNHVSNDSFLFQSLLLLLIVFILINLISKHN